MTRSTVKLTKREFDQLPNYSASIPTGTTIGKRWKRSVGECQWMMGEYIEDEDPDQVGIRWSNIVLASLAEQGVIDKEAAITMSNPSISEIAKEWERMGGVPITNSNVLTKVYETIRVWSGGHLTSGAMRISWHRTNRTTYVTIERAKERESD